MLQLASINESSTPTIKLEYYEKTLKIFSLNDDCNVKRDGEFIEIQLKNPHENVGNSFCLCMARAYLNGFFFNQSTTLIDSDYTGRLVFRCLIGGNHDASTNSRYEGQLHLNLLRFHDSHPGNLASFSPTMFSTLARTDTLLIERFSISSLGSNGIDVTLQDQPHPDYFVVHAKGCLPLRLPFLDAYGFRDTPGLFVLRSRFSRLGCNLVMVKGQLTVINNSCEPVRLGTKFFQIVPPWPWNFSRLADCMRLLDKDNLVPIKINVKQRKEKEF